MAAAHVVKKDRGCELLDAVVDRSTSRVLAALNAGEDVDTVDPATRECALYLAAVNEDVELVTLLLAWGASVDACTVGGETALFAATRAVNVPLVSMLLKAGANVNIAPACAHGATPLHMAVRAVGRSSHALIRHLLACRANMNAQTSDTGNTPLHDAVVHARLDAVHTLIMAGAHMTLCNAAGDTPLIAAIRRVPHDMTMMHKLLELKCGVNVRSRADVTPLYIAACEGHVEVVTMLLQWGGKVDDEMPNGDTALCAAAVRGHVEVAGALLRAGAKPQRPRALAPRACEGM